MEKNTSKRRLLSLAKLFWEQTDEEHSLTLPQMQQYLQQQGIQAERKALYSDLKTLQDCGMDIVRTNLGRDCRYFLAGRTFQLPELKLLVDAVNASAILTQQQSKQLIEKLSQLTSRAQSVQLRRSLGGVSSENAPYRHLLHHRHYLSSLGGTGPHFFLLLPLRVPSGRRCTTKTTSLSPVLPTDWCIGKSGTIC